MRGNVTLDILADAVMAAILEARRVGGHRPIVLGLCGSQGSGKSTLADALARLLTDAGLATAVLSLDDLYKTKADRIAMARDIHPLFRARGVPGTHDPTLGEAVFAAFRRGQAAALPRFDKSIDDRADPGGWPALPEGAQVLIFEGWFVGARPQGDAELAEPVNALERGEDGDGVWRRHANAALARYQPLFRQVDLLVLLAAPGFAVVREWRTEQEHALRRQTGRGMTDTEVGRFVDHYERLTRHILGDMPGYADLVVRLGARREVLGKIRRRPFDVSTP